MLHDAADRVSGRPPAAYSADEQLIVKAVSVGDVTIYLSLRRSWEPDKAPLAEQVLKVTVQFPSSDPGF